MTSARGHSRALQARAHGGCAAYVSARRSRLVSRIMMCTFSTSEFSEMRSTSSRPIGIVIGALLLLTVGATRDDYACHFPDDPHQPISCLVSAVKESIVFDRSNYQGPYYYSEHTMTTDADGMKRYSSVTCKVTRVRREKRKFFELVGSCDMEWLRDAGLVAYTAKPNGYMVYVPRGDGNEARYFKRLAAKRAADMRIPRHGNKGDVVAAYVNDEPEGWEVHVSLGAKALLSKKRKAHAVFYMVKQGHRWSLPSALSGPYYEVMLDGINNGEAFFFKHGSNHRPGIYATFLTMFDKVYLLFDTPDRNNTWVIGKRQLAIYHAAVIFYCSYQTTKMIRAYAVLLAQ